MWTLKERKPKGRTEDDKVLRKTHGIGKTDSSQTGTTTSQMDSPPEGNNSDQWESATPLLYPEILREKRFRPARNNQQKAPLDGYRERERIVESPLRG